MCLKDIGLRDQNTITTLSSTVNMIGVDLYDCLMSTRIFTFDNEEDIHTIRASKIMRKVVINLIWIS